METRGTMQEGGLLVLMTLMSVLRPGMVLGWQMTCLQPAGNAQGCCSCGGGPESLLCLTSCPVGHFESSVRSTTDCLVTPSTPECPRGRFGWKCNLECRCESGSNPGCDVKTGKCEAGCDVKTGKCEAGCDVKTGKCEAGCEDDRYGPHCLFLKDCLYDVFGRTYTGTQNTTMAGHTCKTWERDSAQFLPGDNPHNFCRNPRLQRRGYARQPWCYVDMTSHGLSDVNITSHAVAEDNDETIELCDLKRCNCPSYLFGESCVNQCHCRNTTEVCDVTTGSCLSGCAAGWLESDCQKRCDKGHYGAGCKQTCGTCYDSECDPETGQCLLGCVPGFSGQHCDQAPPPPSNTSRPPSAPLVRCRPCHVTCSMCVGARDEDCSKCPEGRHLEAVSGAGGRGTRGRCVIQAQLFPLLVVCIVGVAAGVVVVVVVVVCVVKRCRRRCGGKSFSHGDVSFASLNEGPNGGREEEGEGEEGGGTSSPIIVATTAADSLRQMPPAQGSEPIRGLFAGLRKKKTGADLKATSAAMVSRRLTSPQDWYEPVELSDSFREKKDKQTGVKRTLVDPRRLTAPQDGYELVELSDSFKKKKNKVAGPKPTPTAVDSARLTPPEQAYEPMDVPIVEGVGGLEGVSGNQEAVSHTSPEDLEEPQGVYGNVEVKDSEDLGVMEGVYGNVERKGHTDSEDLGVMEGVYGNVERKDHTDSEDLGVMEEVYGNVERKGHTDSEDLGEMEGVYGNVERKDHTDSEVLGVMEGVYGNVERKDHTDSEVLGEMEGVYGNVERKDHTDSEDLGEMEELYSNQETVAQHRHSKASGNSGSGRMAKTAVM
ncbi:uncharacterized protein LOC143277062 isoform X2 [Babylonia areolata]|uniref:uncharacterized protein LOC143277047 isoform X2 n=1 Tax=Babylonia areolata TaxID=304850 RepID=UPI003FCF6929